MPLSLRPHQEKACTQLGNGKILYGGVGSGKSRTATAYYQRREAPKDVYVITTAKKRDSLDWEKEFAAGGVGKAKDATVAGVLTVDSWNNIAKYNNVYGAFFIFDEQRLVGSGAWIKAFLKIAKRNHWILLSATPGDTWLDYIPVFVANGFYKNRTEFKREHVVYSPYSKFPKVDRYVGVSKLVRHRNAILVHMPYQRHTVRHIKHVNVEYNEVTFKRVVKDRWNVLEQRPIRDVAELFSVMRRVVNSNTSRLEAVKELLHVHPRLIVFYNFDYELELLRTLAEGTNICPTTKNSPPEKSLNSSLDLSHKNNGGGLKTSASETPSCRPIQNEACFANAEVDHTADTPAFTVAEWNGHRHDPIPDTDRWVYLVQYTAGAEGWNCTSTDAMCFYSLTYSWRQFEQAQGRIDRLNTPYTDLRYYVLISKSAIDRLIMKALNHKENFNESTHSTLLTA